MLPYLYAYLYSIHVSHSWYFTLNILHILAGEYSLYLLLLNTFHPIIMWFYFVSVVYNVITCTMYSMASSNSASILWSLSECFSQLWLCTGIELENQASRKCGRVICNCKSTKSNKHYSLWPWLIRVIHKERGDGIYNRAKW